MKPVKSMCAVALLLAACAPQGTAMSPEDAAVAQQCDYEARVATAPMYRDMIGQIVTHQQLLNQCFGLRTTQRNQAVAAAEDAARRDRVTALRARAGASRNRQEAAAYACVADYQQTVIGSECEDAITACRGTLDRMPSRMECGGRQIQTGGNSSPLLQTQRQREAAAVECVRGAVEARPDLACPVAIAQCGINGRSLPAEVWCRGARWSGANGARLN